MTWPLQRVISGGQSGVDRCALECARALGIPTGGYAPLGWRTEAGPAPELGTIFGLVEAPSREYNVRTLLNVQLADMTVVFGDVDETGSALTCRYVQVEKGALALVVNPVAAQLRDLIQHRGIRVLNVAGNRLSRLGHDGYNDVARVITAAIAPEGVLVVAPPLLGAPVRAARRNGWLGSRGR